MKVEGKWVPPKNKKSSLIQKDIEQKYLRKVFLFFVLASLIGSISVVVLAEAYKPGLIYSYVDRVLERVLKDYGYGLYGKSLEPSVIKRTVNSIFNDDGQSDLSTLNINIKYKQLSKLTTKRNDALKQGVLISSDEDYVSATIDFLGDSYDVKMRLKGDFLDHLSSDKWSYRIKVRNGKRLLGMRVFSVQDPGTRGYHNHFTISSVFKKYGLIVPDIQLVKVRVNGDNKGVMLVEEHFSKEMLERNQRMEGVIVKYNESNFWESIGANRFSDSLSNNPLYHYRVSSIDVFSASSVSRSEKLSKDFQLASSLLDGFGKRELRASQVFDIDLLSSYLAIVYFFHAGHDTAWNNQRFYLNPLTLRLEPIPFDSEFGNDLPVMSEPIVRDLLRDTDIRRAFEMKLMALELDFSNELFLRDLQEYENRYLNILRKEYYFLEKYDFQQLGPCGQHRESEFPTYLYASKIKSGDHDWLEIRNALCEAVEITAIHLVDSNGKLELVTLDSPKKYPLLLGKTLIGDDPSTLRVRLNFTNERSEKNISVTAKRRLKEKLLDHQVENSFVELSDSPMPKGNVDDLLSKYKFMFVDDQSPRDIKVKRGEWEVSGKIVIPKGYSLSIYAGTKILFGNTGSILVFGPTKFIGSLSDPITLAPSGTSWEGIAVFEADEESVWKNVIIQKTTGINYQYLQLNGGVSFYKSDVDISNSRFEKSLGEDALNIIHSNFTLQDVSIVDSKYDGFDGDFVKGSIVDGSYHNIGSNKLGGDALDFSGSRVTVEGVIIKSVEDKAISVGERSIVTIGNSFISNVAIGVASKDASSVVADNLSIDKAGLAAFMAYTKKPEYGHSKLIAQNIEIDNTEIEGRVQSGSYLEINGEIIIPDLVDIDVMYGSDDVVNSLQ